MTFLTKNQTAKIFAAIDAVSFMEPAKDVQSFVGDALGINYAAAADILQKDSNETVLLATITARRDKELRNRALPYYVVYKDVTINKIAGLGFYLKNVENKNQKFLDRILTWKDIKKSLLRLERGHYLEAITATILKKTAQNAHTTKMGSDQGVDCFAWDDLKQIPACITLGELSLNQCADKKLFIVASSKANLSGSGKAHILNPAHVRELVGGWLIQRSHLGVLNSKGVKLLSPLQLLLVTTYRLSENSKVLCRELGVLVWSTLELIYLVCEYAPDEVFVPASTFVPRKFNKWWLPQHKVRVG